MIPREAGLQFARETEFSQKRAFAGDVLYTENMPAAHLYVILEGEVDLYLVRDDKRTVVETLHQGQCFGIETHQSRPLRLHNAAARTYCELALVDAASVAAAVQGAPELAQRLLHTLSQRLATAHALIASRVNYQPDLLVYAQLLHLLGRAEVGKAALHPRASSAHSPGPQAKVPLQDVVNNARLMFGHTERHIHGLLGKLLALHLVHIDDEGGQGKRVLFSPRDIVAQVRKAVRQDEHAHKLSYATVSLDELAAMVEVERGVILRKLAAGDFADDVFTFRRDEVLRLLDEKGRRFFAERRIKPAQEFSAVEDLEFADLKSLSAVASRLDSLDLAKVLATLSSDSPVRERLLQCLPRRRRDEVDADLDGLVADPVEAQQLGAAMVKDVQALMLQR